jgi:superfamily II helicase
MNNLNGFMIEGIIKHTCGHSERKMFPILTTEDAIKYHEETTKKNGLCAECEAQNLKYNMVKVVEDGDIDSRTERYFFKTTDIKRVVEFCQRRGVHLHDEHFNTGCGWDCTGLLVGISVKVTRKLGFIIVQNRFTYDY